MSAEVAQATRAPEPLSIPTHPLDILLPLPNPDQTKTNPKSLQVLEALCDELLGEKTVYSIAFRPVLVPPPGRINELFVMKPHWWQVSPGVWEWRDGQRNPECTRPQGQLQLQEMAKAVHTLSLGATSLGNEETRQRCLTRIEELLRIFFLDENYRMEPEVFYAQCLPTEYPMKGDDQFVIPIRFLILVDQALLLVQSQLEPSVVQGMKDWVARQVEWLRTSEQGQAARHKNKALWYHVILASHLPLILPAEGTRYALEAFGEYKTLHPTVEDAFEEALTHDNRRHRALFTLEPLFILASLISPTSHAASGEQVPEEVLSYVRDALELVKRVEKGPIETPREDDERFFAKTAWFERMLGSFEGTDDTATATTEEQQEPEGEGWKGGWDERMKMLWGFV